MKRIKHFQAYAELLKIFIQDIISPLEEEEEPPKKETTRKKLPYLFIEADEDHVPLQEKGRGRRRKKSRILAKLVYVHEGKEVSSSGRAKLRNPHYFAGCYEDSEELFLEVLEYLKQNYDLEDGGKSSSVVMVPPGLRKNWRSFPNPYLSWTVSISRNASRKPCPRMLQQRNFGKPQKKVFGRK